MTLEQKVDKLWDIMLKLYPDNFNESKENIEVKSMTYDSPGLDVSKEFSKILSEEFQKYNSLGLDVSEEFSKILNDELQKSLQNNYIGIAFNNIQSSVEENPKILLDDLDIAARDLSILEIKESESNNILNLYDKPIPLSKPVNYPEELLEHYKPKTIPINTEDKINKIVDTLSELITYLKR